MEERLLEIIKTGKGEIKDLLEAEKQLGEWREKIERLEGEIRYFSNLVSLSTLNISLYERDIRAAAFAAESETVSMGVEAEDVEKARAEAITAIDEAKGRIVESDLKKLDAGQLSARIVAEVAPERAGPLIDRMKQLGVVARLDIERRQTTGDGTPVPPPPPPAQGGPGGAGVRLPNLKVERRDTRFIISLYNLANVAARQTDTMNLAAEDVETAYRAIIEQVRTAGGRVVTSQLTRPQAEQVTGMITAEVPKEQADAVLAAVRAAGLVMRMDVTVNPDSQNTTETKRAFTLSIVSLTTVAPRETTTLRLAADEVAESFNTLREAVRAAGGRVLGSQLIENDPSNVTATLDFEIKRDDYATVAPVLAKAGDVLTRNVSRSADVDNTVDTKVRIQAEFVDHAMLAPRETVTLQVATKDVRAKYAEVLEALRNTKAESRVLASQLNVHQGGGENNVSATLSFDVGRTDRPAVENALSKDGDVFGRTVARSADMQNTSDRKVRLEVTVHDADGLPPREVTTVGLEVEDVSRSKGDLETYAVQLGGRSINPTLSKEASGRTVAVLALDVPLAKSALMLEKINGLGGTVRMIQSRVNDAVPEGNLSRTRFDVTLAGGERLVAGGEGFGSRVRGGMRTSINGLLAAVEYVVIGLVLVLPCALLLWFAWRAVRRWWKRRRGTAATTTATGTTPTPPAPATA
jgi:hypothetical protein